MTEHSMRCADCGRALDEAHDLPERQPCPDCGSLRREHFAKVSSTIHVSSSVAAEVERGLNDVRLAVLGILVGIGLAVGFGVPGSWWVKILAGASAFAVACLLIGWGRSRHYLMEFMHRLTRR